ncbi:MAG: rRNA methyltransferase, partial [Geodermatophilaceae bacterium]|nr:rRNA methyltransferase [Geodermatophilaceae bacterium]
MSCAEKGYELAAALADELADVRGRDIGPVVRRLIAGYRSGEMPIAPILDSPEAVMAYAAYRMPATYAAVSRVLSQLGQLEPRTMLDLGG